MTHLLFSILLMGSAWAATKQTVPEPPPAALTQDPHVEYWIRTLKAHPLKLVRRNAALKLGKMAAKEAVPVLIDALKDQYPGVRVEAARALGYMGDERAFNPLYEAMTKGDRELKRAASDSVDKIKAYREFLKKKDAKAAEESLR
jgi:HEAT repeat protein